MPSLSIPRKGSVSSGSQTFKETTEASSSPPDDLEAGTHAEKRWRFKFWRRPSASTAVEPDPKPVGQWPSLTRTLDRAPQGYPKVATLQCSDYNFLQFRCFSYLHTRVILALQQEVEMLEEDLDELDHFDASADGNPSRLICMRRDEQYDTVQNIANDKFHFPKTRPQIMAELKTKLMEYDNALLKAKEVLALQKPSSKDYETVRGWFVEEQPLDPTELEFIRRKEDIVTLRAGRDGGRFDCFVETSLIRLDKMLQENFKWRLIQHIFLTPELRAKTDNKRFHYYAPNRVAALVNGIITLVIFILMVLPVVALYEMSDVGTASPFEAIGVLIVFTLLFGCAMSGLTNASRQELFAASAAYSAILVVFIGNFSSQTVNVEGPVHMLEG